MNVTLITFAVLFWLGAWFVNDRLTRHHFTTRGAARLAGFAIPALFGIAIVVLNAIGISGLLPKALISTYLSFFPVVVGMVKGLRSPEQIQLDLMHTYNASGLQTLLKLRWPASVPYLFASLKVAIASALVGAIVGELPTGAVEGLGARLLSGSYYCFRTEAKKAPARRAPFIPLIACYSTMSTPSKAKSPSGL